MKNFNFFNSIIFALLITTACGENQVKWLNTASVEKKITQEGLDVITDIKKINIKNVPNPYNGGFIKHPTKDVFLLAYRTDFLPSTFLGVVELDSNFEQIGRTSQLDLRKNLTGDQSKIMSKGEDPRLIVYHDEIYIVYNDSISDKANSPRKMYLGKLSEDSDGVYKLEKVIPLDYLDNYTEKNWSPFVYNDGLHFVYSFDPFLLIQYDFKSSKVRESFANLNNTHSEIWNYGHIRGGTQVIYSEELEGYVSFFHSSKKESNNILYYHMGAIVFDKDDPSKITKITTAPIIFDGIYKDPFHRQRKKIIFPSGVVKDENNFYVSAGFKDNQTLILTMPIEKIKDHLINL